MKTHHEKVIRVAKIVPTLDAQVMLRNIMPPQLLRRVMVDIWRARRTAKVEVLEMARKFGRGIEIL
jgi:hypothetical protein